MDKAYNHSHLLLHVTWVVWALWVLWRDRDWERNTSSTSTRTRGTMVPTRSIGTPRKAGWTLRPGETWVNHRAGAQPGRRHRLDTFLVKTASLQIVIILRNNHLLHWLAWKKHRPITRKASVQLVARTLRKEIIWRIVSTKFVKMWIICYQENMFSFLTTRLLETDGLEKAPRL